MADKRKIVFGRFERVYAGCCPGSSGKFKRKKAMVIRDYS
jgi:hypothetical protein